MYHVCVKNDLEERASDATGAEEQVKRLSGELSSLQDQLRREKDRVSQVEKQRSGLEAQLRELQVLSFSIVCCLLFVITGTLLKC